VLQEDVMRQGLLTHFDAQRFPQGHNTTNFPRWFKTDTSYPIPYTYRHVWRDS
jgi:hypothetical protein